MARAGSPTRKHPPAPGAPLRAEEGQGNFVADESSVPAADLAEPVRHTASTHDVHAFIGDVQETATAVVVTYRIAQSPHGALSESDLQAITKMIADELRAEASADRAKLVALQNAESPAEAPGT